jgi:hypothetical protein
VFGSATSVCRSKRHERWEIWPPAIGLQEQIANRRKRLWLRAMVVSVTEKASLRRQVWIKKTNASEPPLNCRKLEMASKPGS